VALAAMRAITHVEGKAIKSSRRGRRARHGAWWDLEFSVEPEQPSPKAWLEGPLRWHTRIAYALADISRSAPFVALYLPLVA
jgi:hypothetical protein